MILQLEDKKMIWEIHYIVWNGKEMKSVVLSNSPEMNVFELILGFVFEMDFELVSQVMSLVNSLVNSI